MKPNISEILFLDKLNLLCYTIHNNKEKNMETSLVRELVTFSARDSSGKFFQAEGEIVAVAYGKPFTNLKGGFSFLIRYKNEFYESMAIDTNQVSKKKGK